MYCKTVFLRPSRPVHCFSVPKTVAKNPGHKPGQKSGQKSGQKFGHADHVLKTGLQIARAEAFYRRSLGTPPKRNKNILNKKLRP